MMMVLNRSRRIKGIGRRLIVLIVAFSSVLTFFVTLLQLYIEYRQQRADMDIMLDQVGIFLPPIAGAVWSFDEGQIKLALDAVVHLPHLERATVTTTGGRNSWTSRSSSSTRVAERSYPLTYESRGVAQQIGTMDVAASLDGIYARLLSQGVAILLSNGVKTFLVVGFMLMLFNHLVTHRISELAASVGRLFPEELAEQTATPAGDPGFPEPSDEIDELRLAFDDLQRRLRLAVRDLHDSNKELQSENAERRRIEADLQRLVKELSRANVELERFAYVAAHDLQEPVRTLVSFSQLLDRKYGLRMDAEGVDYLKFIVTGAKHLSALVADLLAYSRSGRTGRDPSEVDCREVVDGVLNDLAPMIEQRRASVTVGPLPRMKVDGAQLHQVLGHLIGNGIKYSRDGVVAEVSLTAVREAAGWRFEVSDNGIGIEPQYHDYVFEVFRRLHTRDAFPGTGIGLAVCKRVVEACGGTIGLRSIPGEGTTFFFTLPDDIGQPRP